MPALAITLIATPALAGLALAEQDTKTVGATTITWDASFDDLDDRVDETIEMSVHWTVDEGFGAFSAFDLRGPRATRGAGISLLFGRTGRLGSRT